MVDKYKISAFRKTDMVTDQVVKVPALRHLINFYHTLEKITYQYKQSIPNKTIQHSGVAEKMAVSSHYLVPKKPKEKHVLSTGSKMTHILLQRYHLWTVLYTYLDTCIKI